MNTYKISRTVQSHEPGTLPATPEIDNDTLLLYEPVDGELVHVELWVRYPTYDLIFGVPDKGSPRYEKEIAFFQLRRVGEVAHYGLYLDVNESKAMVAGFEAIIDTSKIYSPELWKLHHQKT